MLKEMNFKLLPITNRIRNISFLNKIIYNSGGLYIQFE